MASRAGLEWLVDEYVIVGDMWLRRGRSVGSSDAEVKAIAETLGRSPASISRRIGNFAGTDNPGTGLKPITGEPLEVWERLRANSDQLAQAVQAARRRIALLVDSGGMELATGRTVRVVPPETPSTEPVEVRTREQTSLSAQAESYLRENFRLWRDPKGCRLQGIEILAGQSVLRVDLFDPAVNLLIEVKAHAIRDHLRFAVGQLYDYRRYLPFPVELAVLVPMQPDDDLMTLLGSADVGAIWPDGAGAYLDSQSGRLLRTP